MSDVAIRVENLSKLYRIGGKQEKYATLRDTIVDLAAAPYRRVRGLLRGEAASGLSEEIWALKDINFEAKHGEVVGIIGRNGAGKSTLLKILSRITEPTTGYADVFGRVGALLEVGTGFHLELTGRENVFLNGAILGMSREEIKRKFDEIVNFAGVEKFIDTPVKHYSSGMGLRLGFAVAAHLEPEILIVDEVLAVGDAEFQKKCLGKMSEVSGEGRTVLFVSHNMDAILSLCASVNVLDKGKIVFSDTPSQGIEYYLRTMNGLSAQIGEPSCVFENSDDPSQVAITRIEMLNRARDPIPYVLTWDDLILRIHYRCGQDIPNGVIILDIGDTQHPRLVVLDSSEKLGALRTGEHFVECQIDKFPLSAGEFLVSAGLALGRSEWLWRRFNVGIIQVRSRDVFEIGRPPSSDRMVFAVQHTWRHR